MNRKEPDVLVIGAGVSGLTTAICLAEAGMRVDIRAALAPGQTTSAVAGAIWGAHLVGMDDRVPGWSRVTLARLRELAGPGQPSTGIRLVSGREVTGHQDTGHEDSHREDSDASVSPAAVSPAAAGTAERQSPDGRMALDGFRRCTAGELPPGYTTGWRYTAPVVAMPVYLSYLQDRFGRAGGHLETGRSFASLTDAIDSTTANVIVNCAGTGANGLVPDPDVVPVRGQVVVVANPGVTEF